MARAARYGNIQPDVFGSMDIAEAIELAERVTLLWVDDEKRHQEVVQNQTKQLGAALGARIL